jgi:membrane associated rhomboid family serine protease
VFLPIGTDRPQRRPTLINHALIAANVIVYIVQALSTRFDPALGDAQAPPGWTATLLLDPDHFHLWSLITSAFLHAGLLHLLGNMLFLWVFGPNVEDRFGRIGYLAFYLSGAAASGAAHMAFSDSQALGASGAIAAVTGAYLVLFPKTRVRCIVLFFFIGVYEIPATWFIAFQIAWDLWGQATQEQGIAHAAHLGGYGFGVLISLVLLWRRILEREPYDLFTMLRQANRRRQLREVGLKRDAQLKKHWERAKNRVGTEADHQHDQIATLRAKVAHLLAHDDLHAAAEAYRKLLEAHADRRAAVTLSRAHQASLANHFYAVEEYQTAALAYDLFLESYAQDTEAPQIRLLLGRINARYLNDPIRARQLLTEALDHLPEGDEADFARRELQSLGVRPPPAPEPHRQNRAP